LGEKEGGKERMMPLWVLKEGKRTNPHPHREEGEGRSSTYRFLPIRKKGKIGLGRGGKKGSIGLYQTP